MTPRTPAAKATATRKRKSLLMTQFLLTFEKVTKRRVTSEMIRSDWWREAQGKYINIFLPLLEEER